MAVCGLWEQDCSFAFSHLPDQLIAATALVSAFLVVRQLRLAAIQQGSEARTARATLLLTLDEQFETGGVSQSRTRWVHKRAEAEAEVPQGSNDAAKDLARITGVATHLTANWLVMKTNSSAALREAAAAELLAFTVFPNWLETLGRLCREGLLPIADVLSIYRAAIKMVMPAVILHAQDRERMENSNKARWENAIWLFEQAAGLRAGQAVSTYGALDGDNRRAKVEAAKAAAIARLEADLAGAHQPVKPEPPTPTAASPAAA